MSCSTVHYLCVYYSREKKKRPNKPTLLIELFLIPAQNSPLRSQEEKKRETGKTVNRCLAAEGRLGLDGHMTYMIHSQAEVGLLSV